ncbi:MAG: gamma-glutamyl-gamma-aminobutyrate hydrolase family protein [Deltaproteobacteria bacterium]|nr:gamma-glutamyl-gamma-aminobutyrate hydrolase family protein [Deltaproteobacteria bacterium]
MAQRPRILITLDLGETTRRGVPFSIVEMKTAYAGAVERAGGLPLMVAPTDDPAVIGGLVALMDGLVLTGGAFDLDPALYGKEAAGRRINPPKPLRTSFERALLEGALANHRAVLGVCGGMQLLNVVLGGTLVIDIAADVLGALEHEQATSPAMAAHEAEVLPGTPLARLLGARTIQVNSTHHQALDRLAPALLVTARSPDGVIEAVAHRDRPGVTGVQWHPELLDDEVSRALYRALVEASAS